MFPHHRPFTGGTAIMVVKSDITVVKRIGDGSNTMSTQFPKMDQDLLGAIKSVFEGDREIDHVIIKTYEEEEDWDDYEYYGPAWGLC